MLDSGSRHPCTDPHNPDLDISGGCHLYSDVILGVMRGIDMELCRYYTCTEQDRNVCDHEPASPTFIVLLHNLVTSW